MLNMQPGDAVTLRSEPMTWPQICERYPNEWVCLVEIDRPEPQNFTFRSARVVGHARDPRSALRQAHVVRDQYDCIGHYFTGRIRDASRGER
jgi:hypothetical protein